MIDHTLIIEQDKTWSEYVLYELTERTLTELREKMEEFQAKKDLRYVSYEVVHLLGVKADYFDATKVSQILLERCVIKEVVVRFGQIVTIKNSRIQAILDRSTLNYDYPLICLAENSQLPLKCFTENNKASIGHIDEKYPLLNLLTQNFVQGMNLSNTKVYGVDKINSPQFMMGRRSDIFRTKLELIQAGYKNAHF